MRQYLTKLFKDFFKTGKISGMLLILATILSLIMANSPVGESYCHFWHTKVGFVSTLELNYSIEHWINDGLMAVFFLLVGLEIEREFYAGELSILKNAMMPIAAAIGGMLVPAIIHFLFNSGTDTSTGFGIPMATDIAFALTILSLLGERIPAALKIFLTALAIIDDLGAIVIIAIFYAKDFSLPYFAGAIGIFVLLLLLNRRKVQHLTFYLLLGSTMWYFMLKSGVHATITGVLLAFAIPFGSGRKESPSYKLQHFLHRPVSYLILPLFALANTAIPLTENWYQALFTANGLGIFFGLLIGKPLGIMLFSLFFIHMNWGALSKTISRRHLLGAGVLAGIGFTMSIFISILAFPDPYHVESSKISVLVSSALAGTIGYFFLRKAL